MKAIQIVQPGEIKMVELETPILQEDEVLVKLHYVGFCGSDLNTYLGKNPMVKLPVIPGHEIGAVIESVGSKVPSTIKVGLPCTVNPYTNCSNCPSCRNGRPNACQFNETFGVQRNGAMAEYIAVPWSKVIIDADSQLSPKDFTLVEPMSVGFHAVSRGDISDLDIVMVIGCGMIGIGAIVRSVIRGATVIAVDMDDEKLALAKRLGAHHTINSKTENVTEVLKGLTNACGADVIIEAVGSPITYQMAINEVAFTGKVVCIGYAKSEIAFETKYFVQKELDIRGSRNAMPEDFRSVMKYLKRGTCPIDELISGIYKPDEAQQALIKWQEDPGKVFRLLIQF
ncbi:threonine dehydrogenase-like Zn-dependent dehydrogenase [Dysgonomonas alginatilytica]|uniref:Threonine dehydrogenase-like Zn-dependent dehydrogenase n=1 Tax=Dysgonomonas alginatilytica TaxID=1605892 RepID=A0A2V3PRI7_9BACT|nr:zinc-binding alcohol dehydrogenase family protein [Dysgonomonas alginatilytica]PXV64758.1 threonine dehydrogenase-like Zn-dependent dehydrogenase [Dysgonomonas alginatilytica]